MAMVFEIPDPVEQEIRRLRRESAKHRLQRNSYKDELVKLVESLDKIRINDMPFWQVNGISRPDVEMVGK